MFTHFDEARAVAEQVAADWVMRTEAVTRALLLIDLFGKIQLVVWGESHLDVRAVEDELTRRCGVWWRGPVLLFKQAYDSSSDVYARAWCAAALTPEERFAVADRHRSRTGWFAEVPSPIWNIAEAVPPIIVFYSFKGGMGRSTTLASFAIQRAQAGERVCVIDFDLDSPGVGLLLNHGEGTIARWGVVDYLLEHAGTPPLDDYYHRCDRVAGSGQILVFPAGTIDDMYVHKLARVDFEEAPNAKETGISALLTCVLDELKPDWILLDARTGVSEVAGYLLSGIAHLHVLLGTEQDQSWRGLSVVLDRLGKRRILAGRSQSELILGHAMVPPGEAGRLAKQVFEARAEREFTTRYYAEASDDGAAEGFWDVRDIDSGDAPHVAIPFEYDPRLATFADVQEITDVLTSGPYASLAERVLGRFARENT